MKKKALNNRRGSSGPQPDSDGEQQEESVSREPQEESMSGEPDEKSAKPEPDDIEFDDGMVEHIRMQTSLLEEREVSREETIAMLKRVLRQHSLGREKRMDYILRHLKENPP
jgi:hypothetical protein